ncbi:peptide chain release factor N(5)-glutamine methyltransferase [Methylovirgula ligni]|uniref:Release factor glutamine methyltransferase n=1 Tax=Methylovirgula ligni TaxID=569860 RepID=A0A3D9Z098_9HYPH|nr:peptide chain release factor N(5)-glutamine methyltransferase [Methylovirgula ligni]QAY94601.1 peptide chain release factor N(5)-glutamine methyltransferase [Methylovirgula ligni]REF87528.1 release factor glutamine methyltransferase [Methylovirgula ligni]
MTAKFAGFDPALSRAAAQRLMAQAFVAAGIESAALDARLILCAALGIDHADLVREPDCAIGAAAGQLAAMAQRRIAREPVSRILGRREFYGLDFVLGPAALDPRPDTEILVDTVLAALRPRGDAPLRLLDLGVGSGAILAALLSKLPSAYGIGLDRSPVACRIAWNNFAALGLGGRSAVVCGDWTAPLGGDFDAIVSNPPYIGSGEIEGLAPEVRDYDPRAALDGGPDGLAAYRSLTPAVAALLAPDGIVAFEVGAGQSESVMALLAATGTLESVASVRDLGGHLRVVTAVRRG